MKDEEFLKIWIESGNEKVYPGDVESYRWYEFAKGWFEKGYTYDKEKEYRENVKAYLSALDNLSESPTAEELDELDTLMKNLTTQIPVGRVMEIIDEITGIEE